MRDLMKARHKLEELEHQHRMAKMEEELQELRNQISKFKMQQSSAMPPTTVHAPISRKPINSLSYPNIKPPTTVHAPISRKPIKSLSYPNIKRNCIFNLRQKVMPRNIEHRSSTEMDNGIRTEELPKETISK